MKKYFYALVMLSITAIGCNKDNRPVKSEITDARPITLKEVTSQGLPSPYFHYTYDSSQFVTRLQHASGLLQYDLQYEHGRIVRMINNTFANKDTLVYHYAGNQVVGVDIIEAEAGKTKQAELLYDEEGLLKEIRWKKFNPNFSTSITRKLVFAYDQRHNLAEYEDHRNFGNGLELFQTHHFEDYDDNVNVEANYLIKDVFEHFLFLPQVQLQKNNPLSETIIGRQNDWQIKYIYTFSNGLPVSKMGDVRQTRGGSFPAAQTTITTNTTYSYY